MIDKTGREIYQFFCYKHIKFTLQLRNNQQFIIKVCQYVYILERRRFIDFNPKK